MVHAKSNQSLFDIANAEGGTIEAVFDLGKQNDLSITDRLDPGQGIETAALTTNQRVLDQLKRYDISPATVDDKEIFAGIGYWRIEDDFTIQ